MPKGQKWKHSDWIPRSVEKPRFNNLAYQLTAEPRIHLEVGDRQFQGDQRWLWLEKEIKQLLVMPIDVAQELLAYKCS